MVAILRIEYFNKNEEQFAIDVSGYKSYKHFIKAYRSFVNRCNNDGYGTSLLYVGGYFKLHECEETQVVISNKNISKISFELLDDEDFDKIYYSQNSECDCCCEDCECQCEDEPDIFDEIDDKLFFIDEKLDEVLEKLNKKEKKEEKKDEEKPKTTGKKKVLLENK